MKNRWSVITLILVFLFTGFILIWHLGILAVKQIVVLPFDSSCTNVRQIEQSINLLGKNIINLETSFEEDKILSLFPCLRKISFHKSLPNKLIVEIQSRQAIARLIMSSPEQLNQLLNLEATPSSQTALLDWSYPEVSSIENILLIDEDGAIFEENQLDNLPLFYSSDQKIITSKRLSQVLSQVLPVVIKQLEKLETIVNPDYTFEIIKIKQLDQDLLISNAIKIVLSSKGDLLKQLASLQLILEKAKIDQRVIEVVDLRFNKPVVIYSPDQKRNK